MTHRLLKGFQFALLTATAFVAFQTVRAQSNESKIPRPVRGGEIAGVAEREGRKAAWAETLFYVVDSGPGEVKVTMSWSGSLTNGPGNGAPGNSAPGNGTPGNGAPGNGASGNTTPGNGAGGNGAPGNGTPGRATGGWFENTFDEGRRIEVTFSEYDVNHPHGNPTAKPIAGLELTGAREKTKPQIVQSFKVSKRTRLLITVNLNGRFNYRIKLNGPVFEVDPRKQATSIK